MLVYSILRRLAFDLTSMKITQSDVLSPDLTLQARTLGQSLARLRLARGIKQESAALRAGLSRNTAYRLEKGDPGIAVGQVLRYLDAIAPGKSLIELLAGTDPALVALSAKERRRRVRELTQQELGEIDF
jgi:DNA-binding XRE family transcriptional regulator